MPSADDPQHQTLAGAAASRRQLLKGSLCALAASLAPASRGQTPAAAVTDACPYPGPARLQPVPPPAQVPVSEGVVPLGAGVGLYYWDTGGTGPAVVFCHPGTGSALVWPYQQPVFAAAGYRTIAYSRRGYYRSPAGTGADHGTYAGDLEALIQALGIEHFHLVGIAAGGYTLSDYAVAFPQRLLSFTVACSLFGQWDAELAARLEGVLPGGFLDLPPDFRELGPSYRGAYPEGVQAWLDLETRAHDSGDPLPVRVRPRSLSQVSWDKINQVPAPKLLIAGGADLIQPPSLMYAAADRIPGCEAKVIAECGHAPQWERPDVFNALLLDFLARSQA